MYPSKMSLALIIATVYLAISAPGANSAPKTGLTSQRSLIAEPHIINGVATNIEQVPYQVALLLLGSFHCGGSVISENYVITAAHCIETFDGDTSLLQIRAGATKITPGVGWDGIANKISSWRICPGYSSWTADYDIGLIRVSQTFQFSSKIQPIVIPTETEDKFIDYTEMALVSGYGSIEEDRLQYPSQLKSATIPLLPRENCTELMADSVYKKFSPRMICGLRNGKEGGDVRKGDSGGPVVHKGKLIGLTSWGSIDPEKPSVFTNLLDDHIRLFIQQIANV